MRKRTNSVCQMPRPGTIVIGSVSPIYGDDELYRQLRRNLDGGRNADKREARFEMVRGVLKYEVPLVMMVDHSFEDAVEAFTRVNTLGVRLKVEDIESAKVA